MLFVTLLATVAALASMQYGANSAILPKIRAAAKDNNMLSNEIPPPPSRKLRRYLRISQAPVKMVHHQPGTNVELTCEAIASPAPVVQWLKNGEAFVDYEQESNEIMLIKQTSIVSVLSRLIITEPSENKEDIYTCLATSDGKKVVASTTVFNEKESADDIIEEMLTIPSKPRITYFYTNFIQDADTNVVLPCKIKSFTDAEVYWKDNNGDVVLGLSGTKMLPSGDLFIPRLKWADMGDWTCVVKNIFGEDSMATFLYPAQN